MATTGNEIRDRMLVEAIQNVRDAGETVTLASVATHLPDDFNLLQQEVTDFTATEPVDAEFTVIDDAEFLDPATPAAVKDGLEIAGRVADAAERTLDRIELAQSALVAAQEDLADARSAYIIAQREAVTANGVLAKAVTAFQTGLAPYRPSDLIRDHINAETELRRKVATGELPPRQRPRVANSVIDQMNAGRADVDQRYGRQYARGASAMRGGFVHRAPSER